MKPVEWRPRVRLDAAETAYWYAKQGGVPLADAFLVQVESALESIARHPAIGSPRHSGHASDLPQPLRYLPLERFKDHLVYYIDLPEHIEVVRIWHSARGLHTLIGTDE